MKLSFPTLGGFLLVPFLCVISHQNSSQQKPQEKPKDAAASGEPSQAGATERKNPVKPTPENLAEAKKYFGYDCAICHGAAGDGKGDLAASMDLKMKDWRDAGHQVNAGRDYGRRVNQGRHRRRALHGIWQPDVQGQLGRFTGGAQEQHEGDRIPSWFPVHASPSARAGRRPTLV